MSGPGLVRDDPCARFPRCRAPRCLARGSPRPHGGAPPKAGASLRLTQLPIRATVVLMLNIKLLWTVRLGVVGASLAAAAMLMGEAASPAFADTCTGDNCVIDSTVQTPAGLITVSTSPGNVVAVHLTPVNPKTIVIGLPFTLPAGALVSGCPGGCTRTTIETTGGLVTIDTILIPPGPPGSPSFPTIVVIQTHPPGPCRARTAGTTVTFTPISVRG